MGKEWRGGKSGGRDGVEGGMEWRGEEREGGTEWREGGSGGVSHLTFHCPILHNWTAIVMP